MSAKKLDSNLKNMVLVLFVVCLISSFLLAFVYTKTKDKIDAAQEEKKLKAINEVILPGYDNLPSNDMFEIASDNERTLQCYPGKQNQELKSVAIKTFSKNGFNGEITLMVGFLPDGTIHKISVVQQGETPGLGTKMTLPSFQKQFEGKNPENFRLKVKKDGGDVDAITAATISSRAFCDAVERAYKAFKENKGQ